jgi:hypothetical protein
MKDAVTGEESLVDDFAAFLLGMNTTSQIASYINGRR